MLSKIEAHRPSSEDHRRLWGQGSLLEVPGEEGLDFNKSSTPGWTSVPAGMGNHRPIFCQGDRHHQQSKARGNSLTNSYSEGSSADSRQPKEKAAQASEETEARWGSSLMNEPLEQEEIFVMDVDELYLLGSTTRTTIPAQPLFRSFALPGPCRCR